MQYTFKRIYEGIDLLKFNVCHDTTPYMIKYSILYIVTTYIETGINLLFKNYLEKTVVISFRHVSWYLLNQMQKL